MPAAWRATTVRHVANEKEPGGAEERKTNRFPCECRIVLYARGRARVESVRRERMSYTACNDHINLRGGEIFAKLFSVFSFLKISSRLIRSPIHVCQPSLFDKEFKV